MHLIHRPWTHMPVVLKNPLNLPVVLCMSPLLKKKVLQILKVVQKTLKHW